MSGGQSHVYSWRGGDRVVHPAGRLNRISQIQHARHGYSAAANNSLLMKESDSWRESRGYFRLWTWIITTFHVILLCYAKATWSHMDGGMGGWMASNSTLWWYHDSGSYLDLYSGGELRLFDTMNSLLCSSTELFFFVLRLLLVFLPWTNTSESCYSIWCPPSSSEVQKQV